MGGREGGGTGYTVFRGGRKAHDAPVYHIHTSCPYMYMKSVVVLCLL